MAEVNFPAEGTDGAALTVALSNGFFDSSSAPNASGNTNVFDTSQMMHGTSSIRVDRASGTTPGYFQRTLENGPREVFRDYVWIGDTPTANRGIFRILNGAATIICSVFWDSARHIIVQNAAGAVIYTSPVIPINTKYRLELAIAPGTTTTTGQYSVGLYLGDNASSVDTDSGDTANFGTVQTVGYVRVGRFDSTADVGGYWYDDFATSDALAGLIGPEGALPPNAVVTTTADVFLANMRASTPGGSGAMTYSVSHSAGQVLTVTEPVDGIFAFVPSETGTAQYIGLASEAGGGSDTVVINVPQKSAGGGYAPRNWIGTPGVPSASWD